MKHYNIRISGRVQGVYFRASARDVARSLGLRGYVRNEPDGSVYIEVEGEEKALAEFADWCRKGPPRAHVSEIQIQEDTVQNLGDFDIRR